jgi:hypothetical protein
MVGERLESLDRCHSLGQANQILTSLICYRGIHGPILHSRCCDGIVCQHYINTTSYCS